MLPCAIEYPYSARACDPDVARFRLFSIRLVRLAFPLQFAEDPAVPERTVAVDLKYPHIALIGVGNE